jgi:hypothetical protein
MWHWFVHNAAVLAFLLLACAVLVVLLVDPAALSVLWARATGGAAGGAATGGTAAPVAAPVAVNSIVLPLVLGALVLLVLSAAVLSRTARGKLALDKVGAGLLARVDRASGVDKLEALLALESTAGVELTEQLGEAQRKLAEAGKELGAASKGNAVQVDKLTKQVASAKRHVAHLQGLDDKNKLAFAKTADAVAELKVQNAVLLKAVQDKTASAQNSEYRVGQSWNLLTEWNLAVQDHLEGNRERSNRLVQLLVDSGQAGLARQVAGHFNFVESARKLALGAIDDVKNLRAELAIAKIDLKKANSASERRTLVAFASKMHAKLAKRLPPKAARKRALGSMLGGLPGNFGKRVVRAEHVPLPDDDYRDLL